MENLNLKEARTSLFEHLRFAICLSREKASKEKALNADRQKWLRLLIQSVESYGKLLETVQLENLEERIANIEARGEIQ